MPRIKPKAAGLEASVASLCYAAPLDCGRGPNWSALYSHLTDWVRALLEAIFGNFSPKNPWIFFLLLDDAMRFDVKGVPIAWSSS